MRVAYDKDVSETIVFAAEELAAYLERMAPGLAGEDWEIRLKTESDRHLTAENDGFHISISEDGGVISGNSGRSVLLGVYDYLHHLGCRFLGPGKACEYVPLVSREQLPAKYEKKASFSHRGVCIEGADSYENIRDFIDWLPKVGYNSFFLQFKVPYVFMNRWYSHERNPYREAEEFTYAGAYGCMERLEEEIKKRGLILHKVGHGWTGEVLGYETASWYPADAEPDRQTKQYTAELGGVRGLYRGIPANTNLCYHSRDAVDKFASLVVEYAKKNPRADYIHIWLADEYNNVCECEECRKTTVADQYVALLNEIDRRLTAEGLETKLVFLLYQELLWPPVKERLENPGRFVLMFAPISRTFRESYSLENIPETIPEYVRNHVELPTSLGENLAFLRGWQEVFRGDSFVYDYPLGRAHYGDFGYIHISRVIHGDIRKLKSMGLNGYISCQELRVCLPNALPNYIMGYMLFDENAEADALISEYFDAAYGEQAKRVKAYLECLSELSDCDYFNGKGERVNRQMAKRMQLIREHCEAFAEECNERQGSGGLELFRRLLSYHSDYTVRLSQAVYALACGDTEAAAERWSDMRKFICGHEEEFQPYLDVYRILEVSQKYTGFPEPDPEKGAEEE